MEEDAVDALLRSSLQSDALIYRPGATSEQHRDAAICMDSSAGPEDRDLRSKSALKALKLKIIATDELIRKFIELKRRHEKLYRMYRYQEKLIADLEETNRDHLKDKELLKDKLALEKAGNQGFENTIAQFVARLEEADQKKEAAQAGAKEAEETVTQLRKELLDKNKKIERLEKRLDSAKILGASSRAHCGKGVRQRELSTADSGIAEGPMPPLSCGDQGSSAPVPDAPAGTSSEEMDDSDGFVDVLEEAPDEGAALEAQRKDAATTADVKPNFLDTSEERHHPVCLPKLGGAPMVDGSLSEYADVNAERKSRRKAQRKRRTTGKHSVPTELHAEEVETDKCDPSTVTDSGVPGVVTPTHEPLCDMPMLAMDEPNQQLPSTKARRSASVGSLPPVSPGSQESPDKPVQDAVPSAMHPARDGDNEGLNSEGLLVDKGELPKGVPKAAVKQKRSRRLAFRTHRMLLRNRTTSVLDDAAELMKCCSEGGTSEGETTTPALQPGPLEELSTTSDLHGVPAGPVGALGEDGCSDVFPAEGSQEEGGGERGAEGVLKRRRLAGHSKRDQHTPESVKVACEPTAQDEVFYQQNEGQQEVVEGQQEVVDGQQEVVEGQQEVVEGQQEVVAGQQEVVDGQQEVVEGHQEIVGDQQEVAGGRQEVASSQQEVVGGQQEVVEDQQEMVAGDNQLVEGQQELVEGGSELVEDQQEVVAGGNQLVEGQQELVEGGSEFVEDQQEVVKGEQEAVEGQQEAIKGQQEAVEEQQEAVKGLQEVVESGNELVAVHHKDARCVDHVIPHREHFHGMATLMGDFQLSDGSSDEEGESPVEGSGAAPNLTMQEEAKVCGSDSEGDSDSGMATGSAAPSIVSEGGPSPSVVGCEIGMEVESDVFPKTDHDFPLSLGEGKDGGLSPPDCNDHHQSDNCDSETTVLKRSDMTASSVDRASHSPPPPSTRFSRYSLQEIFTSMLPLGRLSPIPPDPPPGTELSKEEVGGPHFLQPHTPTESNKGNTTRPPSHKIKSSCSSVSHARADTTGRQSGTSPSVPPSPPKVCAAVNNAATLNRKPLKKDSFLSPLLSRRHMAGQSTSPPVKSSSAPAAVLPQLSTKDILLSSCSRESPSQHPPRLLLESRSGRGRGKGKAVMGRTVVPKGGTSCSAKGWADSPALERQQSLTEAKGTAATVGKDGDAEDSTVVVSLLQSGGGRSCLPQSGKGRGVPLLPAEPEVEEPMCPAAERHSVEEEGRGLFQTSCDTTTLPAATSRSAASGGSVCRDLVPTDHQEVGPKVATSFAMPTATTSATSTATPSATSTATPSVAVERGVGEGSSDVGSASGLKDVASVPQCGPSESGKMADKGDEEMEDGELGSSDDEDTVPPCDQASTSHLSVNQAAGGVAVSSAQTGMEGANRGPPPKPLEGVGSKRGTPPQLHEDCATTPGPAAKKQKPSSPPAEAFAVVAWLDPLVVMDSPSSGKNTSGKKGGVGVRRGKGQTESHYVQSHLQGLERGEVGVCEVYSRLTKENNVKSRKKLIAGFQSYLYHYKPSWAKLQQKLKTKLDTISSLTIAKTKDTRPLTPQEDPNSTEFQPCLLPFEAQLVWLVLQLSCYYGNKSNVGGVNGQKGLYLVEFKELLYSMVTKETKRFHLKCALIRLYVSCCRLLQGTREHVQLLSCELLSSCEPMVERRLPMVQSIACVWPLALTKPKDHTMLRNGRYIPSALEQHMLTYVPELIVVHTFWRDNPDLFTNLVFKSLFLLCHWRQNNSDSLKAVAIGLVGVLHCSSSVTMVTPPSRGSWVRPQLSVLGSRTVNLLHLACRTIGWKWTSDVLIRTQLWPLLQAWNKKETSGVKEATLVGICTFFGMIGPLGVEYDISAGPGSNCLQLLQKVLISLLVKAANEQDREMTMALQLTIADSLLALCPPGNSMATEAGSALTAWLQHSAKRHPWFSAAVGQLYFYHVQQIATSQHHFVQFNEPTY